MAEFKGWIIIFNLENSIFQVVVMKKLVGLNTLMVRLQNSFFFPIQKAWSTVSVILTGMWGEKTTGGFLYNDFVLSQGSNNVFKVSKIARQVHPQLKFDTLDALVPQEISCVVMCSHFLFAIQKVQSLYIWFSGDLKWTSISFFL